MFSDWLCHCWQANKVVYSGVEFLCSACFFHTAPCLAHDTFAKQSNWSTWALFTQSSGGQVFLSLTMLTMLTMLTIMVISSSFSDPFSQRSTTHEPTLFLSYNSIQFNCNACPPSKLRTTTHGRHLLHQSCKYLQTWYLSTKNSATAVFEAKNYKKMRILQHLLIHNTSA